MKNRLKQIATVIFVVQFLFTTTGFVLYESICVCSGKSNISLYKTSEVCYHGTDNEVNCICYCSQEKNQFEKKFLACNCNSSVIQFVKLESKVIFGTTYFNFSAETNSNVKRDLQKERLDKLISYENIFLESFKPPPRFKEHNEYLNVICQLKIPAIA